MLAAQAAVLDMKICFKLLDQTLYTLSNDRILNQKIHFEETFTHTNDTNMKEVPIMPSVVKSEVLECLNLARCMW